MISDREIKNIEVEPRVYAVKYKYNEPYMLNGTRADSTISGIKMFVCYTYEQAMEDLWEFVEDVCKEYKWKFFRGDVVVQHYISTSITDIFDTAYKEYGVPQPEETPEPEQLNEEN
jgi:hypothetical protein